LKAFRQKACEQIVDLEVAGSSPVTHPLPKPLRGNKFRKGLCLGSIYMTNSRQIETFCNEARQMGALDAVVVAPPRQVFVAAWVRLRCQYGCSEYGQCLTCPPNSPTPETTRKVLDEYQTAILLHGDNWELVREIARTMERTIFLAGYYKAFAFVCGPCWLCKTCVVGRKGVKVAACKHPDKARPAMEAAGIDVFATARAAGLPIEVVTSEECPQNYYALVLVE
jgi:predicted metal-binding protein